MNDLKMDRREFLKSSAAAAAVGAAGPSLFFAQTAMAAENAYDTVVLVFLRGGMDGLSLVVPDGSNSSRAAYEQARGVGVPGGIGIPSGNLLPLQNRNSTPTGYGLHPSAVGLKAIWDQRHLAIVHCCGMRGVEDRSHFNTQLFLDLGTPNHKDSQTGWLTRAFETQPLEGPVGSLPLLAVTLNSPRNVAGSEAVVGMASPGAMLLDPGNKWNDKLLEGMPSLCAGESLVEKGGQGTAAAMRLIKDSHYEPVPEGWPKTDFADQLWTVAQTIDKDLGLRYATVNLGGWDTHSDQAMRRFGGNVATLADGLYAFYQQLVASQKIGRVTVIVQSEFGRRVKQNASGGTDHGYGNPLLVLGGAVNGGRFFGSPSDLASDLVTGDVPVKINSDYRRVVSEILMRRMRNPNLGVIFPVYNHDRGDMGIVAGTSMEPNYSATFPANTVVTLSKHSQPAYGDSLEPMERVESEERRNWLERIMAALGVE